MGRLILSTLRRTCNAQSTRMQITLSQ
jgi:hypothetical protein